MDTIGKLVLDDDGIETVHKNYIIALKKYEDSKKTKKGSYYIPSIRSLVMRHKKFCDYCDNYNYVRYHYYCLRSRWLHGYKYIS